MMLRFSKVLFVALSIGFLGFSFFQIPIRGENDISILVNNENPVSRKFVPNVVNFQGFYVAKEAYEPLKDMVEAAKRDKVSLVISNAYRSVRSQEKLFDTKVKAFVKKGYTNEKAKMEAAKDVMLPRYNEHHTGLAIDFFDSKDDEAMWDWLEENAYRYGFILRYPKEKEDITKRKGTRHHYRYVGREVALKMKKEHLGFEEYYEKYIEEE